MSPLQLKERSSKLNSSRFLIILYFFFFFIEIGYSQSFTFDQLTIDDGLSNNTVYSILEDSDGFIWFGTRDGLNRFDGQRFKIFPIENKLVSSNNIQSLMLNSNGDIWIGLSTGGLAIFSRESQKFIINPLENRENLYWPSVTISSMFRDSKDNVWIGTSGNGVFRVDQSDKNRFYSYSMSSDNPNHVLSSNHCFSFTEDKKGNVWIGTSENSIHVYHCLNDSISELNGDQYPDVDLSSFRKTLKYHDEFIWIATEGKGLFKYRLTDGSIEAVFDESLMIRDLEIDQLGRIIFSTDGSGLYVSDDNAISFEHISASYVSNVGLNTNALYDIFVDSKNNVWLGSFNGGVNVFKSKKAKFYTLQNEESINRSLGVNSVLSINGDSDQNIWMGMDGGGIAVVNREMEQIRKLVKGTGPEDICSNIITYHFVDELGNKWLGSFDDGLIFIDAINNNSYCFQKSDNPKSLSNNNVWAIQEDDNGDLWLGTLGGGLNKFDLQNNRFINFHPIIQDETSISGWNIQSLLIDSDNRLWAGTEFSGLNLMEDEASEFVRFQFDPNVENGLKSNSIRCIFEDRNKIIWIGTEGGGLHKFLGIDKGFHNYTTEDGIASNVINAIEEDEAGKLWISTNRGISFFDPGEEIFTNYYKEDGLLSNQFNIGASYKDRLGMIYFGGITGVTFFDPNEIKPFKELPALAFTDFSILNESIVANDSLRKIYLDRSLNDEPSIHLGYKDNVFTIEVACLEYTYPYNSELEYKMEGFDENWKILPQNEHLITFTNLDQGDYTFYIKPRGYEGNASAVLKKLYISVSPPFWESWWFISILLLLAFFMILGLYKYQINKNQRAYEAEMMKAREEILVLKNEKLSQTLEQKNSELSAALLQSASKNNSLSDIRKKLGDLNQKGIEITTVDKKNINSLIRKIETELDSEDYWELFQLNFDSIHKKYSEKLFQQHPNLSNTELRLCSLIKLGMTNREIASIQNVSISAIEKSKYRIKKKINFSKGDDLNHYLITFN